MTALSNHAPVRVRFAPSPTGYLHVGGARTALYNYLFAKKMGGQFIVRIEDTDQARSTDEAMRMQLGDLHWLGLLWDEGPDLNSGHDRGSYGPYRQSQRLPIYQEMTAQLLKAGRAFYCFCSDEELAEKKEKAIQEGRPPQYDGTCRQVSMEQAERRIAAGQQACVRFRVPDNLVEYTVPDMVRGRVTFPSSMIGDFVILRSDGMPVYNYCCVIDDALMKITHVLRAEEHLPNTLRQMMIYEALGFACPQFGHLSIILGGDRQKLSKRHGATSCHEYMKSGYLPEALLNFIALLGWSSPHGHEILSMAEMQEQFSIERLNPAAAVFDEVKLKWMNATHLRQLPHAELWQRLQPFFAEAKLQLSADGEWQDRALAVFKTSMETLRDAVELFRPMDDGQFLIHEESREVLGWESSRQVLQAWSEFLAALPKAYMTEEEFLHAMDEIKDRTQAKGKFLFMPLRVAVIGKPHGAELKILVPLLNKKSLLTRVGQCLDA